MLKTFQYFEITSYFYCFCVEKMLVYISYVTGFEPFL